MEINFSLLSSSAKILKMIIAESNWSW